MVGLSSGKLEEIEKSKKNIFFFEKKCLHDRLCVIFSIHR